MSDFLHCCCQFKNMFLFVLITQPITLEIDKYYLDLHFSNKEVLPHTIFSNVQCGLLVCFLLIVSTVPTKRQIKRQKVTQKGQGALDFLSKLRTTLVIMQQHDLSCGVLRVNWDYIFVQEQALDFFFFLIWLSLTSKQVIKKCPNVISKVNLFLFFISLVRRH